MNPPCMYNPQNPEDRSSMGQISRGIVGKRKGWRKESVEHKRLYKTCQIDKWVILYYTSILSAGFFFF